MRTLELEGGNADLRRCVAAAKVDSVLITQNGKPAALVVGVQGRDEEDLRYETDPSFWAMIAERRRQPTISRDELDRYLAFVDALCVPDPDVVKEALRDYGVNHVDGAGQTPLMLAAWHEAIVAVRLLMGMGANVNAQDHSGVTALMRAAMNGNVSIAEILLKNGADPSLKDNEGKTALEYARELGNTEAARLLSV